MTEYRVTMIGEVREVYVVEADSPEEARERWAEGDLQLSEASSMDFDSIEVCE